MTPAFCSWVAARLLEQLRSGSLPEPDVGHFAWDPLSDAIRAATTPSDLALVRRLASDPNSVMWAAMLGRAFPNDSQLTDELLQAFEDETDLERSIGLLHHASARSLDEAQFDQLFRWVQAHVEDVIRDQRAKFGDPTGWDQLRRRLVSPDPMFAAKRWVYMYSVHALPVAEAKRVLAECANDPDARVARAAGHSRTLLS